MGWVLGYASLRALPGGRPVLLRGHERFWGVAMDNRVDLPGYKKWLAPDGTRPAVEVAFLDVRPADDAVAGVLLRVADIAALDARERNYRRIDVTALVDGAPPGAEPVWTYVGRAGARARLAAGRAAGTAVVARSYLDLSGARPGGLPVRDLRRVDLP